MEACMRAVLRNIKNQDMVCFVRMSVKDMRGIESTIKEMERAPNIIVMDRNLRESERMMNVMGRE